MIGRLQFRHPGPQASLQPCDLPLQSALPPIPPKARAPPQIRVRPAPTATLRVRAHLSRNCNREAFRPRQNAAPVRDGERHLRCPAQAPAGSFPLHSSAPRWHARHARRLADKAKSRVAPSRPRRYPEIRAVKSLREPKIVASMPAALNCPLNFFPNCPDHQHWAAPKSLRNQLPEARRQRMGTR
jgi:hypothetical protein